MPLDCTATRVSGLDQRFELLGMRVDVASGTEWRDIAFDALEGRRVKVQGRWKGGKFSAKQVAARGVIERGFHPGHERAVGLARGCLVATRRHLLAVQLADDLFHHVGALGDVALTEHIEGDAAGPVLGVVALAAVLTKEGPARLLGSGRQSGTCQQAGKHGGKQESPDAHDVVWPRQSGGRDCGQHRRGKPGRASRYKSQYCEPRRTPAGHHN